ncbi:MAG: hypothetical protein KDC38_15605 [Planctomycetes bacterium]|nr:hypothetical protein [Planctomycetota bacterium]
MSGVRLEPVSMGKGFVEWQVVYPSLAKKCRGLPSRFEDLREACRELKRHLTADRVDPETVALVEQQAPEGAWGEGAVTAASK